MHQSAEENREMLGPYIKLILPGRKPACMALSTELDLALPFLLRLVIRLLMSEKLDTNL